MTAIKSNATSAPETFECHQCGAEVPLADRARLRLTYWCDRCERNGPDNDEED